MTHKPYSRILFVPFVFVILSSIGSVQATVTELISPNQGFSYNFGNSVSGIPDVNGDGRGDVVIGEHQVDRAYIFDGSTGLRLRTLVSPNQETDGYFGNSVSGIADVNGDGRGDVVVGAFSENLGISHDAGRAYIFDGSTGAPLHTLVSPNLQGGGEFGYSVSGVPDVNGDGRGDVVIGALVEFTRGRAYIFDGSTGLVLHTLVSPNAQLYGDFGYSVSGVPDVNGDGRGDVVIGARRELYSGSPSQAGRAYIFDGSTGAFLRPVSSPDAESSGRFGLSVSGLSDVNGDGLGDVVVGTLEDPGNIFNAGSAYVFDGATGALHRKLVSPDGQDSGHFGHSVSGISDIDGDGLGEVVVGAPYEDLGPGLTEAGRAYIFDASTGVLLHTMISPNKEGAGRFGFHLSGVPDVDADGRGDVVVGAHFEDPGASPSDAGRAYISTGDPNIGVSPLSLDFWPQSVDFGPSGSLTVTIMNDWLEALTFTGAEVEIAGADAAEFALAADSGQNPLAPGGTRTLEVIFDPSSVGVKSANLAITTNDPDEATVIVPLSGEGVVGTPTPTPSPTFTNTATPLPTATYTPTPTPTVGIYYISNVQELQQMQNDLTGHYFLANDIDASETQFWNSGNGFEPIGGDFSIGGGLFRFEGTFDGQGHVIRGLYMNRSEETYFGLFGNIRNAIIENVGLLEGTIAGAGQAADSVGSGGALVGRMENSTVSNCFSTAAVFCSEGYAGGLVGRVTNSTVSNCYATGPVSGADGAGGLTARDYFNATVTNCYATGPVSANSDVGGLSVAGPPIGGPGTYFSSYWNTVTSGASIGLGGAASDPAGITGKTTAEMYQQATFVGWDFNTLWTLDEGNDYPRFYWDPLALDSDGDGIADLTENNGPNGGDANSDGIPDQDQAYVATFRNEGDGEYLTVVVAQGHTLADFKTLSAKSPPTNPPDGADNLRFGLFEFNITGVTPGGSATAQLILPEGLSATAYFMYGETPENPTPHWYEFTFDGATGARIHGNRINLWFVDGDRGDHDLAANGIIKDPGGPAIIVSFGVENWSLYQE